MVITLVARTDTRKTGLGKYTYSLYDTFSANGQQVRLVPPVVPPLPGPMLSLAKKRGIDLPTFFQNYPVRVNLGQTDICHLTSQNLALLLRMKRMPPTVLTIHDIYYLMVNGSYRSPTNVAEWADRIAISGVKKAQEVIAISAFTKQTIVDVLGYPAERITVIHRAVDREHFKPLDVPADFRARYGLPAEAPLILFLGSEDPRKNLATLLRAFHLVASRMPEAVLVKAGAVHFTQEAANLHGMVARFGLQDRVFFLENLSDDDLPLLYNTADIVVMPSFFEGFGLPALEALTCGRPVIAANASSLPEVVGSAGMLFNPHHADELALALVRLLEYPEERYRLSEAALAQAQNFSLAKQAQQTWDVYRRVHKQVCMI
jgi:glycosyltransferase involved in cell wall biosynthesis